MFFKPSLEINGVEALRKRFSVDLEYIGQETIARGVVASAILVEGTAKEYIRNSAVDEYQNKAYQLTGNTYLASKSLRRISGMLANSITHIITRLSSGEIEGTVGTNSVYGRIHEIGGVIKAKRAPFLVFRTDDGLWHRVKSVTMPARPFLLPALLKNKETITKLFSAEYYKLLKERGIV